MTQPPPPGQGQPDPQSGPPSDPYEQGHQQPAGAPPPPWGAPAPPPYAASQPQPGSQTPSGQQQPYGQPVPPPPGMPTPGPYGAPPPPYGAPDPYAPHNPYGQPPSYGQQSAYADRYLSGPQPRKRRRPHGAWWLVPVGLIVTAVLMLAIPAMKIAGAVASPAHEGPAASLTMTSIPEGLTGVWVSSSASVANSDCALTGYDDNPVTLQPTDAPLDYEDSGRSWTNIGTFTSNGGYYKLSCNVPDDAVARVAPTVSTGGLLSVVGSFVVGFLGVIVFIILLVLALTGASRKPMPHYPGPGY